MTDLRYRDKIEIGADGNLVTPTVVLTKRSCKEIGVIRNIQNFRANHPMGDTAEISFDVYKYVNGVKEPCWDSIKDFKFVLLPTVSDNKFKWYEITVNIDETTDTIKHVTGIHANEAELGQLMLYEVEINTEGDIDRDEYQTIMIDGKEYGTVFYCPEHPKNSLLHRILADKASHYQIIHVDDTLKNIQREFSFNGISIVDAMRQDIAQEIQCLFVFGENLSIGETNEYQRTIAVYDLLDYCEDCGERGNYNGEVCTHCGSKKIRGGYGKDSGIFVNTENLTDSISFTSATDQVKNFFRMAGGDDDMTAAIRSCNPSGSSYLTYFTDDMKEDMSEQLVTRLNEYDELYDSYLKDRPITLPSEDITTYNLLVDKYQEASKEEIKTLSPTVIGYTNLTDYDYNSVNFRDFLQTVMMPHSEEVDYYSAQDEIDKLTVQTMSPIGVEDASDMSLQAANTAVRDYAKVYVDTSMYKVDVSNATYLDNVWKGTIKVTSLTEYDDTADKILSIRFDNNDETFIKQKIEKAMAQYKLQDIGDVSFLQRPIEQIAPELNKYSLDSLRLLDEICSATMDILAQAGYGEDKQDFYDYYDIDFYDMYYYPYWQKRELIMAEEEVRQAEVNTIEKVVEDINTRKKEIMNLLNIENFFGNLYPELMLYRRESEYSNPNFISDGLTDSEIIQNAQEFFKRAREEIIKAANIQHTISGDLYNLFLMPEFRRVVSNDSDLVANGINNEAVLKFLNLFDSGNWLRIRVDDKIYKLRMTNWEIEYDSPEKLNVEFSDVIYGNGIASDIASILSQARTMGNSYSTVARQARKGSEADDEIGKTRRYGLLLDQNKIISDINEQSFVINSKGALMRAKDDFGVGYSDEQVKILNKGIYYTNDGWKTVNTGLGHFIYYDPDDKKAKEDYGVVAKTVVGRLILGNKLKIYSESDTFEMGDDGLIITAHEGKDNHDLFALQKDNGDGTLTRFIYVDGEGNTIVNGKSVIIGVDPLDEYLEDEFGAIEEDINGLEEDIDEVDAKAQDAARYAMDYISVDNSGLMVADLTDTYPEYYKPQTIPYGKNVLITNNDVQIREGHEHVLALYGSDEIYLGDRDDKNIYIHSIGEAGVDINDNDTTIAHFGEYIVIGDKDGVLIDTDGVDILRYDEELEQPKSVALFGETVRVGEINSGHTNIGSDGMKVYRYADNAQIELANIGYGRSASESGISTSPYYTMGKRATDTESDIGNYSMVEGIDNTASGVASHAEGRGNTVSGHYSHAEGRNNTVTASYAHVGGVGNTANALAQTVIGKYSKSVGSDDLFVIGNGTGTSNNERSTALRVKSNGSLWSENGITSDLVFDTRSDMISDMSGLLWNRPYNFYADGTWTNTITHQESAYDAFGMITRMSTNVYQLFFITNGAMYKSLINTSNNPPTADTQHLYTLNDIKNTFFTISDGGNTVTPKAELATLLEGYAKTGDVPSVTGYVTTQYLEDNYKKTGQDDTYAKASALSSYISNEYFNTYGATKDWVNGTFATTGWVEHNYNTKSEVSEKIQDYVVSSNTRFANAVDAILKGHGLIT